MLFELCSWKSSPVCLFHWAAICWAPCFMHCDTVCRASVCWNDCVPRAIRTKWPYLFIFPSTFRCNNERTTSLFLYDCSPAQNVCVFVLNRRENPRIWSRAKFNKEKATRSEIVHKWWQVLRLSTYSLLGLLTATYCSWQKHVWMRTYLLRGK